MYSASKLSSRLVQTFFRASYSVIIVVALIYQGGLALYYQRKTPLVTEALEPRLPPNL